VGGKEVAPGSPNAVTVRVEGFTLIRNGTFRITWTAAALQTAL
jgi:hypothetical protein